MKRVNRVSKQNVALEMELPFIWPMQLLQTVDPYLVHILLTDPVQSLDMGEIKLLIWPADKIIWTRVGPFLL